MEMIVAGGGRTLERRLLRGDFALLLGGLVQSRLGDACLEVGLMWLIFEKTGLPGAAATLLALEGLPKLLGPLAGVIVDRASKRFLILGSDLLRGLLLCSVFVLDQAGLLQPWHLYVLVVLLATLSLFYGPALKVLLPHLVEDSALPAANSALQVGQQLASIAGAGLAGLLLAVTGAVWALLIDGMTFLLAALVLSLVSFPSDPLAGRDWRVRAIGRELWEGLRFVFSQRELVALTGVIFLSNLILGPVNVVLPAFSVQLLEQGLRGFGLLAAALSCGLLAGGIAVGAIGDRLHYKSSISGGLAGIGFALALLSVEKTISPAVLTVAALGFFVPFIQIPLISRIQRSVVPGFQGRVFATLGSVMTLAVPIGALIAGQALSRLPVQVLFRWAGALTLAVTLYWMLVGSRRGGSPDDPSSPNPPNLRGEPR